MPRQSGGGLKYWSFDVGLLRDKKIRQIKGEFGLKGIMIFIYILNTIYEKEGYFMRWEDDDDCYFMSDDIGDGCSPNLVEDVVHRCIQRSLFDEGIFNMFGVLTSASIQRRFLIGVGNNRNAIPFIQEYWLLDRDNPNDVSDGILKKIVFFSQNPAKECKNLKENAKNLKENDTNKIKENKTKVNKNKVTYAPTEEKKNVRHKYGEYENVLLSDDDLEKLKSEYPNDYEKRIERLSEYIASTGKSYKNHLATIRAWARRDKPENQKTHSIYCVDENEDTLDDLF